MAFKLFQSLCYFMNCPDAVIKKFRGADHGFALNHYYFGGDRRSPLFPLAWSRQRKRAA